MKAKPVHTSHDLFPCPACGWTIRAQVTVDPNIGPPKITADRRASIAINTTITRFEVSHPCTGRTSTSPNPADMTPAETQEEV